MLQETGPFEKIHIPKKSFFKNDEVSGLTGIKPYVLRFWEKEFLEINPLVSSSGQKLYEAKDIEVVMRIKELLYKEKLSIEDAKSRLRQENSIEESIEVRESDLLKKEDEESSSPLKSTYQNSFQDLGHQKVKEKILEALRIIDSVQKSHQWN